MNYKAHESSEKQVARDIVCNWFLKLRKGRLKCLSLPSTNFHFEKMLLGRSKGNLHIDCVERDDETYLEALKDPITRNSNISFYKNDIFKHLEWKPNAQYDLIWLDLCAQMTNNLVKNVGKLVMSKQISDVSYLAVTFMGKRERPDLLRMFQAEEYEEIRTTGFPNLVINAAMLADRTCELVCCHKYRNDNFKAVDMRLYVFEIRPVK